MRGKIRRLALLLGILVLLWSVSVTPSADFLLVADDDLQSITEVNIADGRKRPLPLGQLTHPRAVSYDPRTDHVYWTDYWDEVIMRAHRNGSGREILADSGVITADGLALDLPGRNVYWTDLHAESISVARLDGRYVRTLVSQDVGLLGDIVVDPANGYMFWTDWRLYCRIERAAMDGTGRTVLISYIGRPRGLAIDYTEQRIYWSDAAYRTIQSADLSGHNQIHLTAFHQGSLFGLALDSLHVYWTAWNVPYVIVAPKSSPNRHQYLASGFPSPNGIYVNRTDAYAIPSSACSVSNGGCGELCLARPGGRTFACRNSWTLQNDSASCSPIAPVSPSFLWIDRERMFDSTSVVMLPGDSSRIRGSSGSFPITTLLTVQPPSYIDAIDYDIRQNLLFWVNPGLKGIYMTDFSLGSHRSIVRGISNAVKHLAADWLNQNLYYTDGVYNWIGMVNYNTSYHYVIIQTQLDRPRGIVIHPIRGFLFWNDWGKDPKIESATLSGENRTVLVNDNLQRPSGMVIDYLNDRLFWADTDLDVIESCDLNGSNRRLFYALSGTLFYDITFDGREIVIADWYNDRLIFANGTDEVTVGDSKAAYIFGVEFYDESRQPWTQSECQINNGGCQHTCVRDPEEHRCLCLPGYVLAEDKHTCLESGHRFSSALLVATEEGIIKFPHNIADLHPMADLNFTYLVQGHKVFSIDYNYAGKMLFYVQEEDNGMRSIRRLELLGQNDSFNIYTSGDGIGGIAVDWVSSNLYWTERLSGRIHVSRLDGSFRQVLIDNLSQPRGIAVHPPERLLFWTEAGTISRASLAGTDRRTVVPYNMNSQPIGIAIDLEIDRLYWVDSLRGTMQSCNLTGGDVQVHWQANYVGLFGVTTFKDYVLWTDRTNHVIRMGVNNAKGSFVTTRLTELSTKLYGIRLYHRYQQQLYPGPCDVNNGGCEGLCLPTLNGRICGCGDDGYLHPDGQSCGPDVPVIIPDTTPTSTPVISSSTSSTPSSSAISSSTATTSTPSPSSPAISSSAATTSTPSSPAISSSIATTSKPSSTPSSPAVSSSSAPTSTPSSSAISSSATTTKTPSPPTISSSTAAKLTPSPPAISSSTATTSTTSSPAVSSSTASTQTPSPPVISLSTATTSTPSSPAISSSTVTTSTPSPPDVSSSTAPTSTPSSHAVSSSTAPTLTPSSPVISSSTATTPSPSSPTLPPSTTTTPSFTISSSTTTTSTPSSLTLPPSTTITPSSPTPPTTTTSISTPTSHAPGTTSTQTPASTPTTPNSPVSPTFAETCPQGQTIVVELPADAEGWVHVDKTILAWDRNGQLLEVRGNPSLPGYIPYSTEPQQVVIEATDGWGVATSCSFTITVNDSDPPRLTCPADITRLSETPGDVINWDEPIPEDNSGQTVRLLSNHRPGVRFSRYGVYTVTYTAVDAAGNRATCDFSISIESPAASCDERDLPAVRNGRFRGCRTTAGVTTCTLLCDNGFRPTVSSVDCLPSGRWDRSQTLSCLSNQLPVQVSTSMSFTFNDAPCRDNDDFANVVQTQLRASFANTGICRVANQNRVSLCDDKSSQVITSSCQSLSSPRKQRDVTDSDIPSIQKTANSDLELEKYNKRHPRSADELLITSPQSTAWLHKIPNNKMYTSTDDAEEKLTEIETMAYSYGDVLPVRRGRDVSGIDVTVEATVSPVSTRDTMCSLEQRLNAVTQIVKEKVSSWSIYIDIEGKSHTVDSNSFSSAGVTHRYADGRASVGRQCVEDSGWRKTVGIVVPCALLAIVLCIAFACLSRRKNKRQRQQRWDPRFTDLHTRSNPSFNPYDRDPVYEEIPGMVAGTKESKGDGLRVNLPPLSRKENFYSVEPTDRKQRPYASGGPYASGDFKYPPPSLKSYFSRGYSPNPTAKAPLPLNPALGNVRRPSLASQASGKYSTRSDVSTVYENMSDFGSTFTVSKIESSVGKKSSNNDSCDVYSVNFGKNVRSSRF